MRCLFVAALLFPSIAQGAMLPVLTQEPPNPAAYKRVDVEGWNFLGSQTVGMWHHLGEENGPDLSKTVWQPLPPGGAATFWLTRWGGFIGMALEKPDRILFPGVTQFGCQLPAGSSSQPLYAGDSLTFSYVSHEFEYQVGNYGQLHVAARFEADGFSRTGNYLMTIIDQNVPEQATLGMAAASVMIMASQLRRALATNLRGAS